MAEITIELDDDIFARASELAAARDISVSDMVSSFLKVVAEPPLDYEKLSPLTRKALGMLSPMTEAEEQDVLDEVRMQKYGS